MIRPGVDDDGIRVSPRPVEPIDNGPFVVRLEGFHRGSQIRTPGSARGIEIGKRRCSIDVWSACAEQVEVGSVDDQDAKG